MYAELWHVRNLEVVTQILATRKMLKKTENHDLSWVYQSTEVAGQTTMQNLKRQANTGNPG